MDIQVSIIVPVYNVEKYLEKCLNSLVNQTLKSIEIIVVNDGSPDQSQIIIDRYAREFPNTIVPLVKNNGGLGDARNYGISFAKGKYIGFVDSDDYVEITMFEKLYRKAELAEADLVVCDILYEWENTSKTMKLPGLKIISGLEIQKAMFLSPLFAWNKLYKKEIFRELGILYPKKLWYEDIPVTLPIIATVHKIEYVEETLIHYIQRENSIMGSKNNEKYRDIFTIIQQTLAYFKDKKVFEQFKLELEYVAIEQLMLYGSFRFYRTHAYNSLIHTSFNMMKQEFPDWKNNPYIKYISKKYQVYLKVLTFRNAVVFKNLLNLKDTLVGWRKK